MCRRPLTAVERREASVISRLPFRPTRGGTNVSRSFTSVNTGQCCGERTGGQSKHTYRASQELLERYFDKFSFPVK